MNFREYLNSSDLGRHYLNEGVKEVKQIGNYIKLANELKSSYDDIQSIAKKYGSLKNFRNDFSDLLGEFADNLTDLQKKAVVERPKNKKELREITREIIAEKGPNCDLNFIDVSNITDMSELFYGTKFDGDISKWDVSNVKSMAWMFDHCPFNQDISKWDVTKVKYKDYMFDDCTIKDEFKPNFR